MLNNITNINSIPAKTLLAFAMNDALMKAGNPFLKDDIFELVNDPLIVHFGYSAEMEYGMRKIADNFDFIKQYADNRFIVLSWALRVIDDYEHMRFHAYKRLTDCLDLTGSVLEKENINAVIRVLQSTSYMTESELYYYGEANEEGKSDMSLYRLSDVKTKIVNLKADVMASIDIASVSDNLKTIWELIKDIEILMQNPNLSDKDRFEWEKCLMDLYSLKQKSIESKEYIDQQKNSRIPIII